MGTGAGGVVAPPLSTPKLSYGVCTAGRGTWKYDLGSVPKSLAKISRNKKARPSEQWVGGGQGAAWRD